jgi:hypothetical protein
VQCRLTAPTPAASTRAASEELLAAIPGDARTLAEDLTSHTHLLGDVFVLEHYLDNTVIPAVEAVCDAVPRIDDEWAEWASKYRQVASHCVGPACVTVV